MIQTKRHLLVEIEDKDIHHIFEGLGNPEMTKYYGVHFDSLEATKEQMQWYRNLIDKREGIWWKIIRIKTGHFVGAVGFNDWDHEKKEAEIGVWILPKFQRKGRMPEVMKAAINYGFDRMELERIVAFVESENLACKKGLKKVKMIHIKTEERAEQKNEKWIDIDAYQIVK